MAEDFPTPGWEEGAPEYSSHMLTCSTNCEEERFPEPLKFLPVLFILTMIAGLYIIYMAFHIEPRMEETRPMSFRRRNCLRNCCR